MINKPSKKVLSILSLVFVLVVIIILSTNNDMDTNKIIVTNKSDLLSSELNDTDSDGLLDWEEDAWETNLRLADTDGDGTSDGEEVRKGRNPLVVGPNDFIESGTKESMLVEQKRISDSFEEGTVSDNLSKKLFASYIENEGGDLSLLEQGDVLDKIISESVNQVSFDNIYSVNNLQTLDSINNHDLKNYANKFAELEYNKILAASSISSNSDTVVSELIPIINNHHKLLMELVVPSRLVDEHLIIANEYNNYGIAMYNILLSEEDPVKALLSIKKLEEAQVLQNAAFKSIADFFVERGIIFSNEEFGIIWSTI